MTSRMARATQRYHVLKNQNQPTNQPKKQTKDPKHLMLGKEMIISPTKLKTGASRGKLAMVTDRYLEFIHTHTMTETLVLYCAADNPILSLFLEHLLLLITMKSFSLDSHPSISFANLFFWLPPIWWFLAGFSP